VSRGKSVLSGSWYCKMLLQIQVQCGLKAFEHLEICITLITWIDFFWCAKGIETRLCGVEGWVEKQGTWTASGDIF
jgi:hypothetical protein